MNRELVISGLVAFAFHGLILSLPLTGGGSYPWLTRHEPLSLTIHHPTMPGRPTRGLSTPPGEPASPSPKSASQEAAPVFLQESVILETESAAEAAPALKKPRITAKTSEKVGRAEKPFYSREVPALVPGDSSGSRPQQGAEPVVAAPGVKTGQGGLAGVTGPGGPFAAHGGAGQGPDVVVDAKPNYRYNPVPPYPRLAKRRGYEGETVLRVEVLETGKVGGVEVDQSSGFDVLDEAALEAVKKWAFVPGTKNGKEIRQWVLVPVRFSLR